MEYMEKAEQYLAHTYNRFQVVVDKAEGVYIYDVNGKKYLDFASGIGVSSLGYGNKEYTETLKNQIDKITHTSNLFYNTPVRYKFLKKDFTESGYIEDVVTRIALVNPQIAIRYINAGKTIIQTNGCGDVKAVIYSIYGKEIAENCIPVNFQYENFSF